MGEYYDTKPRHRVINCLASGPSNRAQAGAINTPDDRIRALLQSPSGARFPRRGKIGPYYPTIGGKLDVKVTQNRRGGVQILWIEGMKSTERNEKIL